MTILQRSTEAPPYLGLDFQAAGVETIDVSITVACNRRLGAITAPWKEVFKLGQLGIFD